MAVNIYFKKLRQNAICPIQAKENDAGYDLFSTEYMIINPFERKIVPTGIGIEIPPGYYGRIAPRSGLAVKSGVDILAGVIDSSYRGEIGVVIINLNMLPYLESILNPNPLTGHFGAEGKLEIKPGDKIAQLIIESCASAKWIEVNNLSETERGNNGFGSTN